MLSMTAFCRKQAELEAGDLTWEIRSVNHRYLETSIRLPERFRSLEPAIRKAVRARLKRGKIDCSLRFRESATAANELRLNPQVLAALGNASEQIHNSFGDSLLPSSLEILAWPGVLQEQSVAGDELEQQALALCTEALDELLAGRAREGAEIKTVVQQRIGSIRATLQQLRESLPAMLAGQRQSLLNNIASLDVELDRSRIEQEVALLASKSDIAEELERLDAHVCEVARLIDAGEPAGRALDFLMQELMREANTICSKSAAIGVTRKALDLKVLIEQIREQVQNIE